jgi:hypothetical protein
MRTLLRLLLVGFFVAPLVSLHAQITIQRSDFQKVFYVGDSMSVSVLMDSTVNVGQVGGPNVYDFSALNLVAGGTLPVVLGSSLPKAASRFPNDTILDMPDEEQAYTFTDSGMFDIGKVKINSDTSYDYVHRSPMETIFRFPMAFGSGYTESITTYDTGYVNGAVAFSGSGVENWIGIVDGYGTLKLPGGATYQCLRFSKLETNCSTCTDDRDINYVTLGGPIVIANSDHTQADTGVVRISGFQVIYPKYLTSVVQTPVQQPKTFSLQQNYPNPFNPSTRINFEIPARGFVTLEVFDVLGRKVATLVNEDLGTGSYERTFDAGLLPSGVYFDRLVEGNLVNTSKLMLVK